MACNLWLETVLSASNAAILAVSTAGWQFCVLVSSVSGPSKQSLEREKPTMLSALSKTALAAGYASYKSLPIPAYWEPWPGKRRATI
jgi:hypothetical protein